MLTKTENFLRLVDELVDSGISYENAVEIVRLRFRSEWTQEKEDELLDYSY